MAVPRMSQISPGLDVNIVLKMDQRSGKLTRGRISDILTRGDHPRGIKVRLMDGKIGRVQSMSTDSHSNSTASPMLVRNGTFEESSEYKTQQFGNTGRGKRKGNFPPDQDYGEISASHQSRSLADYIKLPASSKPEPAPHSFMEEDTVQIQLEKDFPALDTALIAAILADHDDPEPARGILSSLC